MAMTSSFAFDYMFWLYWLVCHHHD